MITERDKEITDRIRLTKPNWVGLDLIIARYREEIIASLTSAPPAPDPRDALIQQMGEVLESKDTQEALIWVPDGYLEALSAWRKFKEEGK